MSAALNFAAATLINILLSGFVVWSGLILFVTGWQPSAEQ
jgi:hypothetical protein